MSLPVERVVIKKTIIRLRQSALYSVGEVGGYGGQVRSDGLHTLVDELEGKECIND